jgi:hypothetical protein
MSDAMATTQLTVPSPLRMYSNFFLTLVFPHVFRQKYGQKIYQENATGFVRYSECLIKSIDCFTNQDTFCSQLDFVHCRPSFQPAEMAECLLTFQVTGRNV